ncbi:hypothetical protein [Algoriphagus litoralis]|uniref:hypothetical protein n=1 Tax=Algoriphagus litoralis TaxID=2202829 RepID=UPI000DB9FB13|nr:hypothetical protein [Algoriphagus litoralis]
MKSTIISSLLFLLVLSPVLAQEKTAMEGEKTKMYTVLGKTWQVTKYSDGSKTYEWEVEDIDYTNYESHKSSNFSYNFLESEIGINIWPSDEGAPAVKPWGSWYVALNSTGTWKASKNFHFKSSLGVSWYNFKFENRDIIAVKTPDGLEFQEFDQGIGTKSKISASFVNLTLMPTLRTNDGNLRFGAGAYAGLRVGGRGKFVYDDAEGNQRKQFEKSNMYVENLRYGLRSEVGVGDVTFFFNYDLNDLFQPGKGPEFQAMSFGVYID